MKTIITTALSLFLYTYAHANQPTHHAHANPISAHNIANIQNNITKNTFNAFGLQNQLTFKQNQQTQKNTPDLYGHAPMYGTELMYGEFNEDGTMGRSGGDTAFASLSNIWLDWQHTDNKTKFNQLSPIKNRNDLIITGISGNQSQIGSLIHNWGIYTGYTNSELYNNNIHIDSQGGFFGIFNGFYFNKFNINTNITSGVSDNSADNQFVSDSFTNFWISGGTSISYDIILDNTFVLRPVINAEYTWIKSEDYTSASGDNINNKNVGAFELAPELQAIKHIGNNWFGKMNVKYIMTSAHNDSATINSTNTIKLNNTEYFEYSISVGKNVYSTNIYATIGRQDGNLYGWFGNINIKYVF